MIERLKGIGAAVFGFAILFGILVLGLSILRGTAYVGAWALPFLSAVAGFTTVVGLPILIILSIIRATRPVGASGLFFASYIYGVTLWIWGLLFTLDVWGWLAVIIGLFMAGVGVVPIAMLAAMLNGEWGIFAQLVLGVVLTFGCRVAGLQLAESYDRYSST